MLTWYSLPTEVRYDICRYLFVGERYCHRNGNVSFVADSFTILQVSREFVTRAELTRAMFDTATMVLRQDFSYANLFLELEPSYACLIRTLYLSPEEVVHSARTSPKASDLNLRALMKKLPNLRCLELDNPNNGSIKVNTCMGHENLPQPLICDLDALTGLDEHHLRGRIDAHSATTLYSGDSSGFPPIATSFLPPYPDSLFRNAKRRKLEILISMQVTFEVQHRTWDRDPDDDNDAGTLTITTFTPEDWLGHRIRVEKTMTLSNRDWVARTTDGMKHISFPQWFPEKKFEETNKAQKWMIETTDAMAVLQPKEWQQSFKDTNPYR